MQFLTNLILKIPASWRDAIPHWLQRKIKVYFQRQALAGWFESSQTPPPHLYKVKRILAVQKKYGLQVFIETGTYMGDMIDSVKNVFSEIHSIELAAKYYERAQKIFDNYAHINLHFGDSGDVMKELLSTLDKPALIWLDAHYSGSETAGAEQDAPVLKELHHIFNHPQKHIILIDDARLFTGTGGYPSLNQLNKFVNKHSDYSMRVKADCIWVE